MADTNGANDSAPRKPMFEPTFNIGHLMTGAIIILGVVGSVLTLKDGLTQGLAEMRTENKVQDQRIEGLQKDYLRTQNEDVTFRSEVRQSLTQLSTAVQDLRVKIVEATAAAAATTAAQGTTTTTVHPTRR